MFRRSCLVLLLVACTKEKGPTDGTDGPAPACEVDADCEAGLEICDLGECVDGDRDNGLADASPLFQGEDQAQAGVIWPAGDVDHWAYESTGPEWLSVRTIRDDDESGLDTVVTVYDASGAVHAVMDDYPVWPFRVTGYDTVMYVYLPAAGTWYVGVEDASSYYDDLEPDADPSWGYQVLLRPSSGTGESDGPGDPSVLVSVDDPNSVTVVGVVLEQGADSDWIQVSFDFDQPLEVWGQPGIVGSAASPRVRLWSGADLLASSDAVGIDSYLSWLRAGPGTFEVEATDADGGGSQDHWFPLFFRTYEPADAHPFFGTNTYEDEVEPNDGVAQAQTLSADVETEGSLTYAAFRLEGEIDLPGDADWYSALASTGEGVSVRCWTDRFGSLADVSVSVSQNGQPLGSGVDGDADDYYVRDLVAPGTGPLQVVVSGDGAGAGPGHWYRCAVYVTPP